MTRRVFGFLLLLAPPLLMWHCKGTSKSQPKPADFSFLYNPNASYLHPSYQVYHNNDSISELIVKLFPHELLFNMANTEGISRGYVTLKFELREIDENNRLKEGLADSAVLDYVLDEESMDKRFFISALFRAHRGMNYYMNCEVRDNNRKAVSKNFIYIDKQDVYGQQNFRVLFKKSRQLVFDPMVVGPEPVVVAHADPSVDKLFVKHYHNYQKPPQPVFMMLSNPSVYRDYDSISVIHLNDGGVFEPGAEGMFVLQADTAVEKGLTIMRFHNGFPKIDEGEQLARPLVYLESRPGYGALVQNSNIKLAVDNFWLNVAGNNTERARQLIRIYYNRVFFTNYYFTSYKEGWMTDRGMVFIIYGQPDYIFKDHMHENWVYYGNGSDKKIEFSFKRNQGAFGHNDFELQRKDGAPTYWRDAILSWNSGRVFSLDNI
jgi:GWxTD domain-containing protein